MTELRRRRFCTALAGGVVAALSFHRHATSQDVVVVVIRDYKFVPAQLSIKPGTTVRWVNEEKRTTHTVKFAGPAGLESERLFPGDHFEHRFDQPGFVSYLCGPHPEMTGSIEVRP
jgi:plastocyanin